jgi:hypothetical protein
MILEASCMLSVLDKHLGAKGDMEKLLDTPITLSSTLCRQSEVVR